MTIITFPFFKYDRDQDNTETLKILTPNMMRLGRINTRALSGPLKLPNGASDMVERLVKLHEAWYRVWSLTYIPKLLFRPKWFRNETDLNIGDLVFFQKSESDLGSSWMLGMISAVDRSRDAVIQKVAIKYRNASEHQDRTTLRNVRTICNIWSEDDWNLHDDLKEIAERLKDVEGLDAIIGSVCRPQHHVPVHLAVERDVYILHGVLGAAPDGCCCFSHCSVLHTRGTPLRPYSDLTSAQNRVPFQLNSEVPLFRQALLEEPICDTEQKLDNLTNFMLNFNGC